MDNNNYGGFIISKNVTRNGIKAKWVFREQSSIKECNGWNIYSENDDQEFISNPNNFEIVSADTISRFVPVLLMMYNAPYGTDITLVYKENVVVGFIDTNTGNEVTLDQIINKG